MAPGELVEVGDGHGRVVRTRVVTVDKDRLCLEVLGSRVEPIARPRLVVAQSLVRDAETAVDLLTQVGVDEIVPFAAARSVVRWPEQRAERGRARWQAAAREAAKQSRRAWVPEVTEALDLAGLIERLPATGLAVVLHEQAAAWLVDLVVPQQGDLVVVVGPEGGLTDEEVASLGRAGAYPVRLGPEVVRAVAAGMVAAAALLSRTPRWRATARQGCPD